MLYKINIYFNNISTVLMCFQSNKWENIGSTQSRHSMKQLICAKLFHNINKFNVIENIYKSIQYTNQ